MLRPCPVCGVWRYKLITPANFVQREVEFREDFVHTRIGHRASPVELKDLTDFMHGFAAPLVGCSGCGLMMRAEERPRSANDYEEDPNDPALMEQVYPRYVEAFRKKEDAYRDLLAPHADVLEIGSHLGGFLQVAEEWNWRPLSLDVGLDTSEFVHRKGFTVRREVLEDSRLADGSFDGVFIWNCFEQLDEPASAVLRAWRLLRNFGLLVVRVPNALFYRVIARQLQSDPGDLFAMRALAYNNLLGFPYLYGYTGEQLNRLIEACGFRYLRGFNSELITLPFPDLTQRIEQEQRSASAAAAEWSTETTAVTGSLTGPWIELVYRKMKEADWQDRSERLSLVRPLPRHRIDLRFLERAA